MRLNGVFEQVYMGNPRLNDYDATAKSPKNGAKTAPTLQNRGGKGLLTLASIMAFGIIIIEVF